ncbi:hypothetical protein C8J57DRAFT_1213245 [Mycena rebaudengoi]|nr:hypothetical protein C8J57DRAFT_1213245 [Mycena rebaudengoi]
MTSDAILSAMGIWDRRRIYADGGIDNGCSFLLRICVGSRVLRLCYSSISYFGRYAQYASPALRLPRLYPFCRSPRSPLDFTRTGRTRRECGFWVERQPLFGATWCIMRVPFRITVLCFLAPAAPIPRLVSFTAVHISLHLCILYYFLHLRASSHLLTDGGFAPSRLTPSPECILSGQTSSHPTRRAPRVDSMPHPLAVTARGPFPWSNRGSRSLRLRIQVSYSFHLVGVLRILLHAQARRVLWGIGAVSYIHTGLGLQIGVSLAFKLVVYVSSTFGESPYLDSLQAYHAKHSCVATDILITLLSTYFLLKDGQRALARTRKTDLRFYKPSFRLRCQQPLRAPFYLKSFEDADRRTLIEFACSRGGKSLKPREINSVIIVLLTVLPKLPAGCPQHPPDAARCEPPPILATLSTPTGTRSRNRGGKSYHSVAELSTLRGVQVHTQTETSDNYAVTDHKLSNTHTYLGLQLKFETKNREIAA